MPFSRNGALQLCLASLLCWFSSTLAQYACDGSQGHECYIQLGGVHRSDCQIYYQSVTESMIRAINALNDGKGFGVRSGENVDKYFFKLNYTGDTYEPGERDSIGRAKALQLFPQLDLIIGMGDKCADGDAELLKFAEEADQLSKMYFTTRGPSRVLTAEPQKKHFFSMHLNSDNYPSTAIAQYALRGMKTASVIWEDSPNWFFMGVGESAVRQLEHKQFNVQVNQQVRFDESGPDWAMVDQSIKWAVGNRSEVLIVSMRTTVWPRVLDLLQQHASEHAFSALWAVNVPWGGNCAGEGKKCAYAVGASQMSNEEIMQYKDELLDMTYREFAASEHFTSPGEFVGTEYWDIASITSSFVQAIQAFYRFRPIDFDTFLADPDNYDALRTYMREGSQFGATFAGPTKFTRTGAYGGRASSTMQTGEDGAAKLLFHTEFAETGFVCPSPASEPCDLNFYREYADLNCPLCAHSCLKCPNGSGWVQPEVCGCLPGYYQLENPVNGKNPSPCLACPNRAVCEGGDRVPYPVQKAWGSVDHPDEFFECRFLRCNGGPDFSCRQGFGGQMCEDPQEGWFSLGRGIRLECPSGKLWQILTHMAFGVLVLLFFSCNMVLSMFYESIAIFVESMQRLAIVSHFWLRWPERFAWLFTVLEIILLEADLTPPECLMEWHFAWSFWLQIVVVSFFIFVVWVPVIYKVRKTSLSAGISWSEAAKMRKYEAERCNRAMGKSLDVLIMVYPTLAKNSLDAFTCRELGGEKFLVVDPNFRCGTPTHIATMAISGILIPLFVLGLPIGTFYVLVRGTKERTLHEQLNIERIGVMYTDFKPPFLWWESWRTMQKLILVMLQVFLWQYPLLQGNLALVLFLTGLATHFYAKPYASRVLDVLDSAAYFCAILFTLAGLTFYSQDFSWHTDGLYYMTIAGLAVYSIVTFVLAYRDVRERMESRKAAEHIKLAARKHLEALGEEGNNSPLATSRSAAGSRRRLSNAWSSTGRLSQSSTPFGSMTDLDATEHLNSTEALGSNEPQTSPTAEDSVKFANLHRTASVLPRGGTWMRRPTLFKPGTYRRLAKDGLTELPRTLNGREFKRWTKAGMCTPGNYRLLKTIDMWLKPWVSDQSPTSQFSLLPEAAFYRGVNQVFPNFFDWIRWAEQEDISALKKIFGSVLKTAELPNLGYKESIVPGDQSSVIYWLINEADSGQRAIFFEHLDMMKATTDPRRCQLRTGAQAQARRPAENLSAVNSISSSVKTLAHLSSRNKTRRDSLHGSSLESKLMGLDENDDESTRRSSNAHSVLQARAKLAAKNSLRSHKSNASELSAPTGSASTEDCVTTQAAADHSSDDLSEHQGVHSAAFVGTASSNLPRMPSTSSLQIQIEPDPPSVARGEAALGAGVPPVVSLMAAAATTNVSADTGNGASAQDDCAIDIAAGVDGDSCPSDDSLLPSAGWTALAPRPSFVRASSAKERAQAAKAEAIRLRMVTGSREADDQV